jgi:hypothetical protein
MEERPFLKAYYFSDNQEIPHSLWNLEVNYHVYKSPLHVPILSQINPVLVPILFPEDPFNNIISSML